MIPRTGKVSIVGATTVDEVRRALDTLRTEFGGIGISTRDAEPVVENIVVNGSIGGEVVLETVMVALGMESTEYEPELFPGLIHRLVPNGTPLLFQSGTFVLTGLTNYGDVWEVTKRFTETLDDAEVSDIEVVGS